MTTVAAGDSACLHAVVTGLVQGVSFRYYTQRRAEELGLAGWVRNRRDGSVEVTAEGGRELLLELAEFLRKGPPYAEVTDLQLSWHEPTGEFNAFDVRY